MSDEKTGRGKKHNAYINIIIIIAKTPGLYSNLTGDAIESSGVDGPANAVTH